MGLVANPRRAGGEHEANRSDADSDDPVRPPVLRCDSRGHPRLRTGPDDLRGTDNPDRIDGNCGPDSVRGLGVAKLLIGDTGNDATASPQTSTIA
jgi:hypothetical protein